MKILILEDETLAAEKIANLLKDIDDGVEIVGELKSIESAVEWFETHEAPGLIISDIRLLDGLSFEIFSQVDYKGPVIFTTAYDQYAIKAFEVNSIDYLLKPVQKDKLEASLHKFKDLSKSGDHPVPYEDLLSIIQAQKKEYKSRFMIRSGQKILAVPVEKIAYFYSHNKLTYIVTHDQKKYPLDQPLEVIDPQLDPKLFFRANRQFIVKFDAIDEIHPYFKGRIKIDLKPAAEVDIVISSDKTPEFKRWLDV
ncbi:MAG: LytTR family DNA-binding domain-containing protein [Cytophagales bacterium]|nr:LytTR family DNA-binding domain-containing protein [Cytophagales bacterium]